MGQVTARGTPVKTSGNLPAVGATAPAFTLTSSELQETSLADFRGKNVVLNIFLSVDTGTCAASVHAFNEKAADLDDTVVLCISADLPFAAKRFCGAEGIENVVTLSDFRHKEFGDAYGVRMVDGPLAGLLARAVVVVDGKGAVKYTELVPEIGQEPNYQAALASL